MIWDGERLTSGRIREMLKGRGKAVDEATVNTDILDTEQ